MDVVNTQRKIKLDLAPIRAFVVDLPRLVHEAENKTFSVAFISDRRMKQLNEMFRGFDSTTDVLSFPHEPDGLNFNNSPPYARSEVDAASADGVVLSSDELSTLNSQLSTFFGDIVISAEQAQKQAAENGLDLETEIKQLILHGLLHLCGYDHETDAGEMNKRELQLRKKLKI
jgi:probable rRNA maturation factor